MDRPASERFYSTVLGTLGIEQTYSDEELVEWGDDFALSPAGGERPVTPPAPHRVRRALARLVDRFWTVGTEAGYETMGRLGLGRSTARTTTVASCSTPTATALGAVHHALTPPGTGIDHVWMRIADVGAARRFYETIAPHAGSKVRGLGEDHLQCVAATGSLSLVVGERPSENVHIAFGSSDEAVDAFHRTAISAGYRNNGEPGERPEYRPGYYGAFVLDPDSSNIEVVCHNS